jgi:hypothetical protein
MGVEQQGNEVLETLLAELGWLPSRLADAVNGLLRPGYVARSTVSEWLHRYAALAGERRSITVTSGMVNAVAATTTGIRNLGDDEGGNDDNLRFVHHHLTWVAKLLRQARFSKDTVAHRLLTEWAQLAQLAAWMAHDAGQHGLSQPYFTSGLHAAHTAGDRSVGTYLLVCASQRRVNQGRLDDGIDLGRAARDAVELANAAHEAARSTPTAVRAGRNRIREGSG